MQALAICFLHYPVYISGQVELGSHGQAWVLIDDNGGGTMEFKVFAKKLKNVIGGKAIPNYLRRPFLNP